MSPKRIGPIAQTWYKWKALRLPWRKRFFIGYDLQGNTYWEFRLSAPSPNTAAFDSRWRRIVHYPRSTHYSSVKVSPLWHQWLRHMRRDPPSLEEQSGDVVRQERMKYLAAEADARWEAKPRVMEDVEPSLRLEQEQEQTTQDATVDAASEEPRQSTERVKADDAEVNDPWAKAKSKGPSENWQPTAWTPSAPKKR